MPIELYRIDDRLIHGQVVVGWGQALDIGFLVLVDDAVAENEWEQELYRMGTPPEMTVAFESVADALTHLPGYHAWSQRGILLTRDIATMRRLVEGGAAIRAVNLGGIHYREGRVERLRYVFLTEDEDAALRGIAGRGVTVTAQDVPGSTPVPLDDVLAGRNA